MVAAMTARLPLVTPHEREHTYCSYCPKLCRVACPVSHAQGSETTTPWAKMTGLHHLDEGNLPLDAEHAAPLWACTGCQRCKSYCDHDNEVAMALNAGRAEALGAGVAPGAAQDVVQRQPEREARAAEAARKIFGDAMDRPVHGTVFAPGCSAGVLRPEDARAGHKATEALAKQDVRVSAGSCCGLPLLEAGDREGFLVAARRYLAALEGAREVVFQDPGCLHALSVVAKEYGLESDVRMIHLTELADRHLAKLPTQEREGALRYHDPCRLGRGLGVYDEPRRVLAKLTGRPVDEFYHQRERSECSGAGGQLPRTDRETSDAIAQERIRTHDREGGGAIVTACAGSAHRFASQPDSPEVISFARLLAEALERS